MQLAQHQIEGVQRLVSNGGAQMFYYKAGTGKTRTALAAFNYYRSINPKIKLLVVCPINLIDGAWIEEINKCNFAGWTNFKYQNLHNKKKNCEKWVEPDIYICNFEHLWNDKNFEAIKNMMTLSDWMTVIDESSKMKNHESKTTERLNGYWSGRVGKSKYVSGIKDHAKIRVCMSATPAPNIEHEWWAQMYFLNPEILGKNFYAFKNKYFQLNRNGQVIPSGFFTKHQLAEMQRTGFKYELVKGAREEIFESMKQSVHVVDSLEGMPEEIDQFTYIEMPDEQRKIYNDMKNKFIVEIKQMINNQEVNQYSIANIALTKFLRLRQITSGFLRDEFGKDIAIVKNNLKLNALKDRIESYGKDQFIIWYNFDWERYAIIDLLNELNINYSQLHGDVAQSDRSNQKENFQQGITRAMIAHPRSMAHGFTFTNCHYMDFFSLNYSQEEYSQCHGRTARLGQKYTCVSNHLIFKDTIDEDILKVLQNKMTSTDIAEKYLRGI